MVVIDESLVVRLVGELYKVPRVRFALHLTIIPESRTESGLLSDSSVHSTLRGIIYSYIDNLPYEELVLKLLDTISSRWSFVDSYEHRRHSRLFKT